MTFSTSASMCARSLPLATALLLLLATPSVADPVATERAAAGQGAAETRDGTDYKPRGDKPLGLDVSGHQGAVNWPEVKAKGATFAYVKATEGTGFKNPQFSQQYKGSYTVGLIRGSYHFALPDRSTGAAQADYFINNGGGWSPDGRTLPGALDIEYNPYGPTCYGKSPQDMTAWIKDFSDRYTSRTGRHPTIYTTTNWWKTCTANTPIFGQTNPLWLARYADQLGERPAGWQFHTFWQYNDKGTFPGDQNEFNGTPDRLKIFAKG
ncbi:GH25 family lysozyme M1 (1,4-beta-N-acetylmuramidase) [Crossiella equi]|uniref:Lysozyme n=1 Tax=Crossiella equi TaxID=130796 RepID=A0ABS5AA74_9PSEU|nr:lysozyme [Crossiella equi]MBP2473187.1 GH25 family lysozyme M1 (1,4-beta-N-acetylmuramidase) [Crossiella equi]